MRNLVRQSVLKINLMGFWQLLFVLVASSSAWGLTTSALMDQTCAGYRSGNMICNNGDFAVSPVFSAAPGTPPICIAGQSFSFQVDLWLSSTNTNYDVGFFAGQQGNDPTAATAGNICSVATFPTTPLPWGNLNGNACGDFQAGGNQTTTVNQIKVVCTGDSAGALQIPYVVTYGKNSGTCTGPADVLNDTPPKCNKGTSSVSGTIAVYSGAYVDVTKQTSPDGDSQPFSFTATGPAGSKVIALTGATLTATTATGGMYTPATIALATNTTTVTLTDGQTARFYIIALAANQTLTITEAATTNWEPTAAISCAAVTGSPTLTTDDGNRTINAVLNTTNSAAACTITNTLKMPLLSILKFANKATANPGEVIIYTVQITNTGAGVGTNVVLTDSLSPYGAFSLNSYAGVRFAFTDSSPISGLSLGAPQYSNNNSSTWIYSPVSGGGGAPAGYDGNVTNWQIPMTGAIRAGGSFSLNYQVIVK